jgi:hypothetical protein
METPSHEQLRTHDTREHAPKDERTETQLKKQIAGVSALA